MKSDEIIVAPLLPEIVPVNRVPMSILREDEEKVFRTAELASLSTEVQEFSGQKFGLRRFKSQDELFRFIQPGDVMVSYSPLNEYSDPVTIAKRGMSHAAIVVKNGHNGKKMFIGQDDGKICHLDSPLSMSGCSFYGDLHFFRVVDAKADEAKTVEDLAVKMMGSNFNYDAAYKTEVLDRGCKSVAKDLKGGKVPDLYCSELPYTLWSLAQDKPLFQGLYFSKVLENFNQLRSQGAFKLDLSPDKLKASMLSEFQRGVAPQNLVQVDKLMDTYLATGTLSDLQRAAIDRIKGLAVPPSQFMVEAQKPERRIVYVGSTEGSSDFYPTGDILDDEVAGYQPPRDDALWTQKVLNGESPSSIALSTDGNTILVSGPSGIELRLAVSGELIEHITFPPYAYNESQTEGQGWMIQSASFTSADDILVNQVETRINVTTGSQEMFNSRIALWKPGLPTLTTLKEIKASKPTAEEHQLFLSELGDGYIVASAVIVPVEASQLGQFSGCFFLIDFAQSLDERYMLRTYPTQCLEKSGNQIKLVDRDPLAIGAVSPTEEYAAVITGTEKWSKIYQMSIMQRQTKKIKHQFPALTFDEFAKTFSTLGFLGHLHKMFYIHNPTNMIKEVSLEAANSQAQDFGVSAVPADLTEKGMEVDDEFFSNLQILVRDVAPQDHQHNVVARVLEVGTGNTLADLHGSRQKITGLELSSDSRYVYSADEGGFLRAFEWGRVRAR